MAKHKDISLSSQGLKYKLKIAFSLMSILPLLVCIYLVSNYILPSAGLRTDITLAIVISIFIAIIGFFVIKEVFDRILSVTTEAKLIAAGDVNRKIDSITGDEVGDLGESLNHLTRRIRTNMEELKNYSEKTTEINLAIQKRVLVLSSLLQVSSLISQGAKLEDILKIATEKSRLLANSETAYLLFKEEETDSFYMKIVDGVRAQDLLKIKVDPGEAFEQRIISEEDLLSLLSEQLYIPTLHLTKYKFDPEIIQLIPERMARQYNIIPLSRMGNTLTVSMSDPLNIFALDDLKTITGCSIDTVLSPQDEITRAIDTQYHLETKDMQEILEESSFAQAGQERKDLELLRQEEIELTSAIKESEKAPIVKLVDLMLGQALKKRASDIHIEPEWDCLRIRYRIDGSLHDVFRIPKINQNAIIARIKIISNLDITESRIPQDGRFKVKFEGKEVDFRVSGLPTTFGQKFVLRLLDKANLSIGLDKLGFSPQPLATFKEAITKPFGMILITGPTGSGKSTTLYSILSQLNTPERNIVTIEDPVEYQVEGITQIQVKPEIGLDFASGLRSILRQSPDVIMIGEIRDSETADIAIKASLTGQLVLSTLHTNDAISSITRLIDMDIEPFLVASSLVMLCAQRLARKICLQCRKPVEVSKDFLESIGFKDKVTFYAAGGCKYCNNTGFYGRIAILESILIDDIMREMIIKKSSLDEIRQYATEKRQMKSLRDDAFLKVKEELTTLDEALRITTEE